MLLAGRLLVGNIWRLGICRGRSPLYHMYIVVRCFHSFVWLTLSLGRVIRFGFYPCPGEVRLGLYNSSSCPLVLRACFKLCRRDKECSDWAVLLFEGKSRMRRASIIKAKSNKPKTVISPPPHFPHPQKVAVAHSSRHLYLMR
jgi:hypothetical protein